MIRKNGDPPHSGQSRSPSPEPKPIDNTRALPAPPADANPDAAKNFSWAMADALQEKRKRGLQIEAHREPAPILAVPGREASPTSFSFGRGNRAERRKPSKSESSEKEKSKADLVKKNEEKDGVEASGSQIERNSVLPEFKIKDRLRFVPPSPEIRREKTSFGNEKGLSSIPKEGAAGSASRTDLTSHSLQGQRQSQLTQGPTQPIAEKRHREASPPSAKASKPDLDGYEVPKPPQKKNSLLSRFLETSEAKVVERTNSITHGTSMIDRRALEVRQYFLKPGVIDGRSKTFGCEFISDGKEKKILEKHSDLGLKNEQNVRDAAADLWSKPLSNTIVERSQKDGTLIRLDKNTGVVVVADIADIHDVLRRSKDFLPGKQLDKLKGVDIGTATLFNPGYDEKNLASVRQQRQRSFDYFNRS